MLEILPLPVIPLYMNLQQFKSEIMPLREKLLSYSLSMLGHMDDAEDTVQETLLRLWNIREQLDSHTNPGGLSMQITKNICIDKLRSRKITVVPEDNHFRDENEKTFTQAEIKDAVALVRKIIDSLPELQQKIILMRDVEGYELEEIADITGTQVSAVRMNLSRARKKVRDKYLIINNYKLTIYQQ